MSLQDDVQKRLIAELDLFARSLAGREGITINLLQMNFNIGNASDSVTWPLAVDAPVVSEPAPEPTTDATPVKRQTRTTAKVDVAEQAPAESTGDNPVG